VARYVAGPWWAFLIAGLAWFVLSIIVLQLDLTSVTAVGVLLGVIFLVSALEEFLAASVTCGWVWARVLLGILFFVAAIWSFADPIGTFVSIADLLGFLLIFKGTLDLVTSIMSQAVNSVWWLGLVAGLLELFLGFWAAQQYIHSPSSHVGPAVAGDTAWPAARRAPVSLLYALPTARASSA
jgi:uncharacterized membrane protein HdeD (DUF308 family)